MNSVKNATDMKKQTVLLAFALLISGINVQSQEHNHEHSDANSLSKKQQTEWGIADDSQAASRTVQIVMTDNMRFSPDSIQVQQGDVTKFVIKNDGKMLHEFVIGAKPVLDRLAVLVARSSDKVDHARSDRIHVAAGKAGELFWNFNRAGVFDFACLLPGHYQSGMVGKINVSAAGKE